MVQPNTAMLDRHHNVVEDARKEALELVTTAFKGRYDLAEDEDTFTALDDEKASLDKDIHEKFDSIVTKIVNLTSVYVAAQSSPNVSLTSNLAPPSMAGSSSLAYKGYQKEAIPRFTGEVRKFPEWRREMVEEV